MRPSLEAEIIELEKRIATLEKNKIGNLRREHGEIISTYEKMFETLRFVNFNKILMVLKINMMEIKSLEEDCSRECSKNQLIALLQKEMATCLMKMIQIAQEENAIMLENNERLRDKIRFKRLEVAKMKTEKDELLNKACRGNKVIVCEKNIDRYCVTGPFKFDIFSPTYDTAALHPKVLNMKRSKIPVLKLPLTSVIETVPFQIRKKPIKVSIPHDRLSVLKKPNSGRVVKTKNTHNCEKKCVPKSDRVIENRLNRHGKRTMLRKSSNNFTVMDSKPKFNLNSRIDNVIVVKNNNVENNSKFETPKSNSKIPVRVNTYPTKKNCPNKRKPDFAENLTPARPKRNESDKDLNKSNKDNNNRSSVTVEDAALVFKTLNDYCDKIEKIYGPYETSASHKSELTQKRSFLCSPCIPILRTDQKKVSSPGVVTTGKEKFYGSVESIGSDSSEEQSKENNQIVETEPNQSLLSTSTDSSETGTTVVAVELFQESFNGSLDQGDQQNLCLEKFLSSSKCFTPPNEEFRAGGDCLNSSVAGNFRYLDYESENNQNTPNKSVQYRTDVENQDSPNSPCIANGKRRKSEIFHISFNSNKKNVHKTDSPSVFKII